MVDIFVSDRAGQERQIDVQPGLSLMDGIRDNGFDELLALCGGCCSCATCHVYIDPVFGGLLPPMSEDENDLLDSCGCRDARSRLSCQVRVVDAMSGLRVSIAPEG